MCWLGSDIFRFGREKLRREAGVGILPHPTQACL